MGDYSLTFLVMIFIPIIVKLGLDVRKLERENTKLKKLVTIDPLTGLGNLRARDKALQVELSRVDRSGEKLVFARIDVDDMGIINKRIGHEETNVVLVTIAKLISTSLRATDQVFRFGGDEFDVIMPSTQAGQAMLVLQRVRFIISDYVFEQSDGGSIRVSVSIGLTEYTPSNSEKLPGRDYQRIILQLGTEASDTLSNYAKEGDGISVYNISHTT